MRFLVAFIVLVTIQNLFGQELIWESQIDSIPTLSSPRPIDLTGDGVLDIVIGGGTDGEYSSAGVMAFNGASGALLWQSPSRNELFGSPIFQDISGDGIDDIFITGREAQFLALNGVNGNVIWDFFPYGTNPSDSGWYNFYNPQKINDVNGDSYPDFLVTNGGDHTAPEWETNRPPGHVVVLSAIDGTILAEAVVPDSAETYCSPIICDLNNDGNQWVLFGTGGENLGGNFYACPLESILNNTMDDAIVLASDSLKGFIAPPSVVYNESENRFDIYILSYDGKLQKFSGSDFSEQWSFKYPNTESSAAPVIGNFTGGFAPDVFLTLFKGIAPSYSDFYQVMLDGADGSLKFIDSLGQINYSSGNAVDLNNDGRDEALASITYFQDGFFQHRIESIDFETNSVSNLTPHNAGVNLGSSPLLTDLDDDGSMDFVFANRNDSLNPVAWNGITIRRINLQTSMPNAGIAWGSYLGSLFDGSYNNESIFCGDNSVVSSSSISDVSCNGFSDGAITPNVTGTYPSYTYHWSNGMISPSISSLPEGTYTVHITDSLGCMEALDYVLSDPYEITYGAISSPTCPGGSDGNATLSSSGCPCMFSMCTFLWENGITTKPNDALVSGWNTVVISHTDGCIVEDSVFVPESIPVIDSIHIQNVSCFQEENGGLTVVMDSLYTPYNILWQNGSSSTYIDSLPAGLYGLWVEDSRGCTDSIILEVQQPDPLLLELTYDSLLCYPLVYSSLLIEANGGTTPYSYSLNQFNGNSFDGLTPGQYTVSVSDSNMCFKEEEIAIVQLEELSASFEVINASGEGSLDGVAIVTPQGGLPPYSYTWSTSQTDSIAVYLNPGWYTVLIADQNDCIFTDSLYIGIAHITEHDISDVLVYPNPTFGFVQLSDICDKIALFSHDGKWIASKQDSDFIDLSLLANGIYYLSLTKDGESMRKRIIRISN